MADIADIAEFFIPEVNTEEISKSFMRKSLTECVECGDDIPEIRQKIGGVIRCVGCQSDFERASNKR